MVPPTRGGGFQCENHFRLVTSAARPHASILELLLSPQLFAQFLDENVFELEQTGAARQNGKQSKRPRRTFALLPPRREISRESSARFGL